MIWSILYQQKELNIFYLLTSERHLPHQEADNIREQLEPQLRTIAGQLFTAQDWQLTVDLGKHFVRGLKTLCLDKTGFETWNIQCTLDTLMIQHICRTDLYCSLVVSFKVSQCTKQKETSVQLLSLSLVN